MTNLIRKTPTLILVEGEDEQALVESIIESSGLPRSDVVPLKGDGNISKENVGAAMMIPGPKVSRAAVIRDAHNDPSAVCDSIRGIFQGLQIPMPSNAFEIGHYATIRTGFAVLPSPNEKGSIEDLCLRAPSNPGAMSCADELFECLANANCAEHVTDAVKTKARVQAYLAASATKRVVHRVGLGIRKGCFNLEHEAFQQLRHFLSALLCD